MIGQHQPMLIGREPDQRKAKERRRAEIEALGAIRRQDVGQTLLTIRVIQQGQIDAAPRRLNPRHDDLHRPAQVLVLEAGAQARMALTRACAAACSAALSSSPCSDSTSCTV